MKKLAVVLVVGALVVGLVLWARKKPEAELIDGAAEMSREEKIEQARAYAAGWVRDFEQKMKEKNAQNFIGEWKGVSAHEDGCDLDLSELNLIMDEAMMACPMFTRAPIGGGLGRVLVHYKSNGPDPLDADCSVRVLFGGGGAIAFARTYYPDPRIFAVWLKKG